MISLQGEHGSAGGAIYSNRQRVFRVITLGGSLRSGLFGQYVLEVVMAFPLLLIPGVLIAALIAYIKLHAAHITIAAATAAVTAYISTRDFDAAGEAAFSAGANAATRDLVGDFFRFRFS